jgi:hypothetical protein
MFPVGKRLIVIGMVISTVTSGTGNRIECEGVYTALFEIDNKKFVNSIHVQKNLSEEFILGINFF